MFILLDIDGVMVRSASWKRVELLPDGFADFSAVAVNSLKKIIFETGASIVLTSSHKSHYSLLEWTRIFSERGITTKILKLEDNIRNLNRKDEVLKWIQNNPEENFVILDDDKSLNDLPQIYKERLVLTLPLVGLQDEHAEAAIHALNQITPVLA